MVHGDPAELPNLGVRGVLVKKPKTDDMEEQRVCKHFGSESELRYLCKMGVQVRGMGHREQVIERRSCDHGDPRQRKEV